MELKERLEIISAWITGYDLENGEIFSSRGKLINCINGHGYIIIRGPRIQGKQIGVLVHQLVWWLAKQEVAKGLDHIDRNKTNNSIANLRISTPRQNLLNTHRSENSKGYGWDKNANKWKVQIGVKNNLIYGGYFTNEKDAISKANEIKEYYKNVV